MPQGKLLSLKGLGATVRSGTDKGLMSAKDGSELKKQFKAMDLRSKLVEVKKELALGTPDHKIAEKLGVGATTYNNLKRELYRQETAQMVTKSSEDVFLEYKWAQEKCIQDLDVVIGTLQATTQYNALVGLIRARSDITDKVLKTGQEMGLIEKAPDKKLIIHGHAVATMSDAELRNLIATELHGLGSITKKYGNVDMLGNPIGGDGTPEFPEVLPATPNGPTFNGKDKPGQAMQGPAKAAAARKSRQVKRTKVIDSNG